MNKFYSNLTTEERRKARVQLNNIKILRKKQLETINGTLVKYMKDNIKLIDEFLKNKITLEHYLKRTKQFNEWFDKFLGDAK